MKKPQKKLLVLLIASICVNLNAEERNSENTDTNEKVLDTITVTARGFSENILHTPFVVDVIDVNQIEENHFVTAEDALRSQPSANIHNGGNVAYSSLWMRGTGSLSITNLDDNSVDFRVDGVSNGKTGLARNLVDVERIEIAKGPQGTLLGSKAEAGSVAIKTFDPEDEFDARVKIGVGNFNNKSIEAMINAPINDNFALRIAGMSDSQDNRIIKKEDGKPLNTKKKQGIQAKIGWHDDAYKNEVVLGAYYDKQTNNIPVLQQDFSTYEVATFDLPHHSENTAQGVTLSVKSKLSFADFTSQTGYHKYEGEIARPYLPPELLPLQYKMQRIPAPFHPMLNSIFSSNENNRQRLYDDYKQLSQEFRIASKAESDIKWVAGLYFDKKERNLHSDAKLMLNELPNSHPIKRVVTATAGNGDLYKTSDSNSQAIFGEITYPATDKLDIIAGMRVTHKELKHDVRWEGNSNNALATSIKTDSKTISETAVTGRLGLSYKLTPNWNIYALQSRGNKFGGFGDYETNVVYNNPLSPYKSTEINATEIGAKFQSTDERLNLGVAIYQNTMKNDHISLGGLPPVYKTESANVDSRSRGIEIDGNWQANDHLKIYGELALTETEITHVPQSVLDRKRQITKKGNRMPQVPNVSANIGVQYRDELSFISKGEWFADANYRYVGSRYAQADNVQKLDAYHLFNAQVGMGNDHHKVSLWGKNLTNEKYLYIGVQPGNVGTLAPERTFGIDYTYQF